MVVMIDGEDVKSDTCSLRTYCNQRKERRLSNKYIPDEVWLEILSKLPIKSLFISRSVCKSWNSQKIENMGGHHVPLLCGLILISFGLFGDLTKKTYWFSYFCLKKGENFIIRDDYFENKSIYSSGFDKGLLSDLSFDFSVLQKVLPNTPEWQFTSFVMHGGLLLLTCYKDCTSQVYNPATRQICFVPKSPTLEKYGFCRHNNGEKHGLVIQLPTDSVEQKCRFMVVRFCFKLRIVEVYHSMSRAWRKYRLNLDDYTLTCQFQNYVSLFENGVLCLYVLTKGGHGIAIKLKGPTNSEMKRYFFPLPEIVAGEIFRANIWECEKRLYLTYAGATALCVWKAGSTDADTWEWIPVLEISPAKLTCAFVHEHLTKYVVNNIVRVEPLACHPNIPILYLVVKTSVFAYDLNTHASHKIGELKDFEHRGLDFVHTFKPCFGSMDASNEKTSS